MAQKPENQPQKQTVYEQFSFRNIFPGVPCQFFRGRRQRVHFAGVVPTTILDGIAQTEESRDRTGSSILPAANLPGRQTSPRSEDHPPGLEAGKSLPQRQHGGQNWRFWTG